MSGTATASATSLSVNGDSPLGHSLLRAAFAALDQSALRWCLLRVPARDAPRGDVDLLVGRRDRAEAGRLLEELGFVRMPVAGTPDLLYLAYSADAANWICLHLTSEISFGPCLELKSRTAEALLARRVRDSRLWLLTEEDGFWTTLLHDLLDKGEVQTRRRAALQHAAVRGATGGPLAAVVAARCPAGWNAAEVPDLVRGGEWTRLKEFGAEMHATWLAQDRWSVHATRVAHMARVVRHPLTRWRRRGVTVALLGPDGAGKTSLAASLSRHSFFDTYFTYMEVRDTELQRFAGARVPGATFVAYLGILWGRYLPAMYRRARGEVIVFDRYKYDAMIGRTLDSSWRKRIAKAMHARALPSVDLGLVLDAPGELMHGRKGERTPDDLDAERYELLRLADRLPELEVLDASADLESVCRQANAHIWKLYAQRWGRKGARRQDAV